MRFGSNGYNHTYTYISNITCIIILLDVRVGARVTLREDIRVGQFKFYKGTGYMAFLTTPPYATRVGIHIPSGSLFKEDEFQHQDP